MDELSTILYLQSKLKFCQDEDRMTIASNTGMTSISHTGSNTIVEQISMTIVHFCDKSMKVCT